MPTLDVLGRPVPVSNLEKVMYPSVGFTKADVVRYYLDVADVLLPHLRDRPLTLKRYPDGVDGEFFYQKNCPEHRPPWIRTARLDGRRRGDATDHCIVDDVPGLVWLANLADLELHTMLARAGRPDRPDLLVFDLDPGPGVGLQECAAVALDTRERLEADGLVGHPKTSGGKGMQVYAAVDTSTPYDATKAYARDVAGRLEQARPRDVTSNMRKDLRRDRVLVDWSQNTAHKTTVCAYSLRARERPWVSTPVTWREVEVCASGADALRFEPEDVVDRVRRLGDLFAPTLGPGGTVPSAPRT